MITNPPFENFDDYVASLMRDMHVPGAAIAIVQEDRVVLSSGYGVRRLGGVELVDTETMFAIGSITKALTTSLIARLVDEDKMSWDACVTDYISDFQLFDEDSTKVVTIRDLITHRTGLPSTSPLIRYELPFSGKEVVYRLRYVKPVYPFRSRYCYNDVTFAALSLCTETASGIDWPTLMREKLFAPLSMNSSHMSTSLLRSATNLASPHGLVDGKIQPVVYREKENSLSAASANSNLNDVIQFLRLHLSGGMYSGKQIISEKNFNELHAPQMLIRERKKKDGLLSAVRNVFHSEQSLAGQSWSGLGWEINDYRGHQVIRRSGAVPGMGGQLILIPEIKVGIAILSNSDVGGKTFLDTISSRIVDACLKLKSPTASKASDGEARMNTEVKPAAKLNEPVDLMVEKFVGKFYEPMLGDAEVISEGGKLVLAYGNLVGDLEHVEGDSFWIIWRDPYMRQYRMFAVFSTGSENLYDRLEVKGEGLFERVSNDSA